MKKFNKGDLLEVELDEKFNKVELDGLAVQVLGKQTRCSTKECKELEETKMGKKKKSKKQDIGPLSVDPYPPTIKREVLIRDNFDFFLPPTLLIEIGTFLKKIGLPSNL